MQSAGAHAGRILAWEQIDLPNQVYRVQNVRWVDCRPDVGPDWVECSGNAQWREELEVALRMLGLEFEGRWAGLAQTVANVCHGLAWQVPII